MFKHIPKDGVNRGRDILPHTNGMQARIANFALLLALALAAPVLSAQDVAPDALLRAVSVKVIDKISEDQGLHGADPAKIAFLVETMVLPLFDFAHMTRLATARNWRLATPEQQRALTQEFKTLLVRTHSSALAHYRGAVIDFKRLRAAPLDSQVTVRSDVRQPGKERMTLDYEMEKTLAGWKIYDVKVAGVRLVATYRDVFAEKVRDGGVDGLIKFLADGNRGDGSGFNSVNNSFLEKSRIMYAIFQNMLQSGRQ